MGPSQDPTWDERKKDNEGENTYGEKDGGNLIPKQTEIRNQSDTLY